MKFKLSLLSLCVMPSLAMASQFERIDQVISKNQNNLTGVHAIEAKLKLASGSKLAMTKQTLSQKTGILHTRYQQTVNGIPVWKAEATVHEGQTTQVTGQMLSNLDNSKLVRSANSAQDVLNHATRMATNKFGLKSEKEIQKTKVKPYIYREQSGRLVEAFLVDLLILTDTVASRPQIMIRGSDLFLLESWEGLAHNHVDGTGPGGNTKTGRYEYGVDFPAFPVTENESECVMENENVKAVDLNHSEDESIDTAFGYRCFAESNYKNTHKEINGAFSPLNDAYYFGNLVFDMYDQWYGTAPLPMQLGMKVHFGNKYENAFWTGEAMYFGDGDTFFFPLVDVNVASHEVSHGFTEFNSGLIYSAQSGGMNEAFSDIAGEAAEFFMKGKVDWLVGADIMQEEEALRFFKDPTLDGKSIGHADDYAAGINVHYSSGVYNRAFYLLSETEGWDVRKAFDVFVYANQHYWIADETFEGGLCGLIMSASVLEYEKDAVVNAFEQVGVSCNQLLDADNDRMYRAWEKLHGFNDENSDDANQDFDQDGLTNLKESMLGTNPKFNDTDFDGLADGKEIEMGLNPTQVDFDRDGMPDGYEVKHGLNPKVNDANEDRDNDGLSNLMEFSLGLSPSERDAWIPGKDVVEFTDDFEGDLNRNWESAFEFGWELSDAQTYEGAYAYTSVDIADNQFSRVDFDILVQPGDVLSYYLKTSTESGYDFFIMEVDGESVFTLAGENDWQQILHTFEEIGLKTISFIYKKDSSVSDGEDRVWVDNVRFIGGKDEDKNSLPDFWQTFYGITDADADDDGDRMSNLKEYDYGTSPIAADTDSDGINDEEELSSPMTNPVNADSDMDGLPDGLEVEKGLDPLNANDATLDMDGDGFSNIEEYLFNGRMDKRFRLPKFKFLWMENFLGKNLNEKWNATHLNPALDIQAIDNQTGTWAIEKGKLKAQAIGNDMQAVAHYTDLFKAGTLWFDLKSSTEVSKDEFILYLDGKEWLRHSGEFDARLKVSIEQAGIHTLTFKYVKNEAGSSETDSVSVDNFFFIAH